MKKITFCLSVVSLIFFSACEKSDREIISEVPEPYVINMQLGTNDDQVCSILYITNKSYVYGHWSDTGYPAGDYYDAKLDIDLVYNVFNDKGKGPGIFEGGVPPIPAETYTGTLPRFPKVTLAYDETKLFYLKFNDAYTGTLVEPRYKASVTYRAYTEKAEGKSHDLIQERNNSGEGICGLIVLYTIGTGQIGDYRNGTLKTTQQVISYDVKAEILADSAFKVDGMAVTSESIQNEPRVRAAYQKELNRRFAIYIAAAQESVADLVESPKAEATKATASKEFIRQYAQADTSYLEAVAKAKFIHTVEKHGLKATAQFRHALDRYIDQQRSMSKKHH